MMTCKEERRKTEKGKTNRKRRNENGNERTEKRE